MAGSTQTAATATTSRGPRLQFRRGTADTPQVNHTRRPGGRRTRRSWAARRRNDEGATMVEAAFVMPIFVLFLFGIIEFSGYLLTKEGTTNTAQAGARMASVQGNDAMADQQILAAHGRRGRRHPQRGDQADRDLARIVGHRHPARRVHRQWARRPSRTPAPTRSAPATSTTTHRPRVVRSSAAKGATPTATSAAPVWRPRPQDRLQVAGPTPQERAAEAGHRHRSRTPRRPTTWGIYVKALHRYYTGLFGSAVTITDQSIGKIEPETFTTL